MFLYYAVKPGIEKLHNRIPRVLVSVELDTQNEDFLLPLRISETLAVKDGKRGIVSHMGLLETHHGLVLLWWEVCSVVSVMAGLIKICSRTESFMEMQLWEDLVTAYRTAP